jgi:hypothetical protein
MQKLNPFDHGINLGELGGINKPLMQFFMPFITHLATPGDHAGAQSIASRLLPAFNDIHRMQQDLVSQGHVLFGSSHMTPQAETDAGFTSMNALKLKALGDLKAAGYTSLSDLGRDPNLSPYNDWYTAQKDQVMAKYPAYQTAIAKGSENTTLAAEALAVDEKKAGPAYDSLRLFTEYIRREKQSLSDAGYTSAADYPPGTFGQVSDAAVWFYQQLARKSPTDADTFKKLYKRNYAKAWGPIERSI